MKRVGTAILYLMWTFNALVFGHMAYLKARCWLSEDCAGNVTGGGYWCKRCYTSATGTDRKFHTVWYNVNRGYSPICEVCWHKISTKERVSYFDLATVPWMREAVVEDWQHADWYRALHRRAVEAER